MPLLPSLPRPRLPFAALPFAGRTFARPPFARLRWPGRLPRGASGEAAAGCPHAQAALACALALARVRPPDLADVLASHADAA